MSGDDIDTSQLRAAFVQAQAQIMNNGAYEPVVVISKPLALSLLDEIERLRTEVERLMDGMEWGWTIIANGQYWDATDAVRHREWEQAKVKWRNEHWHPALDRNKEARRER